MATIKSALFACAITCFSCSSQAHAHTDSPAGEVAQERSFLQLPGLRSLGRATRTQWIGKAPMVVTAGVRIYVPAMPGLSREALHARVRTELEQGRTGPVAAKDLTVLVRSAQAGYIVELAAPRPSDATDLVHAVEAFLAQQAGR